MAGMPVVPPLPPTQPQVPPSVAFAQQAAATRLHQAQYLAALYQGMGVPPPAATPPAPAPVPPLPPAPPPAPTLPPGQQQIPGVLNGLTYDMGGHPLTTQQALRPFGGGYQASDTQAANAKLAQIAQQNPGQGIPSQLPSPTEQEQENRPIVQRVTHEIFNLLDAIDQYGRSNWNPLEASNTYARIQMEMKRGVSPDQLSQQMGFDVPTFLQIYQGQGQGAAGQYMYEHADPTSQFIYNTATSPLNAFGWGGIEGLGEHAVAAGAPQIVGTAAKALEHAPEAPFIAAKWGVKQAAALAHSAPLFGPLIDHLGESFNPFAVSARGNLEQFSRNVQDTLGWLKNQGVDPFRFEQAAHNPFEPHPFGGYTPTSRQDWAQGWDELHVLARQQDNPVKQLYATQAIETGRQAVAMRTAQVAGDVAKIKAGDPTILAEYDYNGFDFRTPDELIHSLYDNLHNYVQTIQATVRDQIERLPVNETEFTPFQRAAAESVMTDLHNNIHTEVQHARGNINTIDQAVQAAINGGTTLPDHFQDQAHQAMYTIRNLNIDQHFQNAYQQLANHLSGGSLADLHSLTGLTGETNPVYRDFLNTLKTMRAQSIGEDPFVGFLPQRLQDFYRTGIGYGLPRYVDQVMRDKLAAANLINDFWRPNNYGQGIGSFLGYTEPEMEAMRDTTPLLDALQGKGISNVHDLVERMRGQNAVPPQVFNKLNQLAGRYDRSGDILFNDPLEVLGHHLVNSKVRELGPSFADRIPNIIRDMSQSYKERLLLSPAYHMVVLPQELFTGALHGINPLEMTRYLINGMKSSVGGGTVADWLPEAVSQHLDAIGQDQLPTSIGSGGFGSSILTRREDLLGGPAASKTATERLPKWLNAAIGVAHSIGMGGGDPILTSLHLLTQVPFNVFAMPKLVHANADMSRAVEVVLRSIPWMRASKEYLAKAAPDFLDRFEQALTNPENRVIPEFQPATKLANPATINPQAAHILPTNDGAVVAQTLARLRDRAGSFSPQNVADIASLLKVHPDVANQFVQEWMNHIDQGNQIGIDFANHIHFDYGRPTNLEAAMSHVAPFYIWMFRLIPFMLEHLIEKPGILNFVAQAEHGMEMENRIKGRLSPAYEQMMELPDSGGVASALNGQPGSQLMVNPLSMLLPAMGLAKANVQPNEPVGNQILDTASGIGLEPFPAVPMAANALSAASVAAGGPDFFNEPAGSISRQAPIYEQFNDRVLAPLAQQISPAANYRYSLFPFEQAHMTQGNPDAWYEALYNLPRAAMGQRPQTWQDIETRRRLAEMSVEDTGRPNNPLFTDAMNNPQNPLYWAALAQAREQSNNLGALRFVSPLTLRDTNPTAAAIEQQRSFADMQYGPQVASILSRYLPSRFPLINAYSSANAGLDQGLYNGSSPFPGSAAQVAGGMGQPVEMQSLPELEKYLLFVSDYHIPPQLWFHPQVVQMWLQARANADQWAQQVQSPPASANNPLTGPSPVP